MKMNSIDYGFITMMFDVCIVYMPIDSEFVIFLNVKLFSLAKSKQKPFEIKKRTGIEKILKYFIEFDDLSLAFTKSI